MPPLKNAIRGEARAHAV